MRSLLRAEWLRQRRRLDLWGLLAGLVVLTLLGYFSGLANGIQYSGPPGEPVPPEVLAQDLLLRNQYTFPASIRTLLGLTGVGSFLLYLAGLYLGASWTGLEFSRGTIRNVILARPGRVAFFAARLVTLAAALGVFVVVLVTLAALLPALAGVAWTGDTPPPTLGGALVYAAAVWLLLVALALAGTLAATLTRSGGGAVLVLVVYLIAEAVVTNLGFWRDAGALGWLPQLLPGVRIGGLAAAAEAAASFQVPYAPQPDPGALVMPPLVGVAIAAGWGIVIVAALVRRVSRMDLTE